MTTSTERREPSPHLETDNRTVRVFISSTFLDMQAERHELVTRTFPDLRRKYRSRGVEVFEVDLRWGITQEMQERGETLPTLLGEIDRCRPYFIGLLGDRYGWTPPAEALTDTLKSDYPVLAAVQGASVTAMEIFYGALSGPVIAHALFFERAPGWDWVATLDPADRAAAGAEPDAASRELSGLKQLIRGMTHVEPYAQPAELGPKIFEALDALLGERFLEGAPDAVDASERLHAAYARERRGLHIGAGAYLRDLDIWMATGGAPHRLVSGASGAGKSTLIANWIDAWRRAHPDDIVIEHYLGASPDSADPIALMRALWARLNRISGQEVALPAAGSDLIAVSDGLAQRFEQARAGTTGQVLVALDGLDKLAAEQNLRWLPPLPGVRLLVSSLEGEAKDAAVARGFGILEVQSLTEAERHALIHGVLARWGRSLDPENTARILHPAAADLAGSPLYLKTVLEELRVSADHDHLALRLETYCGASGMTDLFDRVLQRLEDDCGEAVVAAVLPLIWASRAGLEETEILAISGVSRLSWATLRNGLGEGLRDLSGRMTFGHDHLRKAVDARYLSAGDKKRAAHLAIADHFERRPPDERQAEELPHQLRAGEAWDRLHALLTDLNRFGDFMARGPEELLSYWLPLKAMGRQPQVALMAALGARIAADPDTWTEDDYGLVRKVTDFLWWSGYPGPDVLDLQRKLLAAAGRLFGTADERTIELNTALAGTLFKQGDARGAVQLTERAYYTALRAYGQEDERTISRMNNLASYLQRTDPPRAEDLFERALDLAVRVLGPAHETSVHLASAFAAYYSGLGEPAKAEPLFRKAIAGRKRLLGPDHPMTLWSEGGLAMVLLDLNRPDEARAMISAVIEGQRKVYGDEHGSTLVTRASLAEILFKMGDVGGALAIERDLVEIRMRVYGLPHPDTLTRIRNLADMLEFAGEHERAHAYRDLLARGLAEGRRT